MASPEPPAGGITMGETHSGSGRVSEPARDMLSWSVREALSRSEPIRAMDMDTLSVEAEGGVVTLRGHVRSAAHAYAAEQIAARVPGVARVINNLVPDEQLERLVAVALAADERTRGHRVAVRVLGGVASLYGAVPSAEDAELVASTVANAGPVRQVVSRLHQVAPGEPVILAWQSSLEGRPRRVPEESAPAEEAVSTEAPSLAGTPPGAAVGGPV